MNFQPSPPPRPSGAFRCALAWCAWLALAAAGCGSSESNEPAADADAGADARATDAVDGCGGTAPLCAQTCGGDAFYGQAECVAGAWFCAEGTVETACPSGTCWGAPLPGEICEGGWQCRPDRTGALDGCPAGPELLCGDCGGFDEVASSIDDCACTCEGGSISCEVVESPDEPECEVTSTSDLPSVSVRVTAGRCEWSLAELEAGVEFGWVFEVEAPTTVTAAAQDGGGCGSDDPSGLNPMAYFEQGDRRWCLCDVGLCPGQEEAVELAAGAWPGSVTWDGRAWEGPSDFGNLPGPAFEPGEATFRVRAVGSASTPWTVESSMRLTIVP